MHVELATCLFDPSKTRIITRLIITINSNTFTKKKILKT